MDDEVLIETVRKYNCLYDPSAKGHTNLRVLKNAWDQVSKAVGGSSTDCKKRWTSLRDQYRRSLRKTRTRSGDGSSRRVKWRLEDAISFLFPYMKERPQKSYLDREQNSEMPDSEEMEENDNSSQFFEDSVESPSASASSYAAPIPSATPANVSTAQSAPSSASQDSAVREKCKTSQQSTTVHAQALSTYLAPTKSSVEKPVDHIRAFFMSIEASVRTLSPLHQLEAKSKISSIVSDLEMKSFLNDQNYDLTSQTHAEYLLQ